MDKLVYIFVPNQFVIGHVFFKLLIKRLAVAMVNKTVVVLLLSLSSLQYGIKTSWSKPQIDRNVPE
jgi:hypothetical protein